MASFSVITYNVAGLPNILKCFPFIFPPLSVNPAVNNLKMSPLLNDYDIIAVQEDFAYHRDLLKDLTHPYFTTTRGNPPFGDGLNFISRFPFDDIDRQTWNKRYGIFHYENDQLTSKGFLYSQFILEPGVYVDIYTLHTDAGDDLGSYKARRDNINQIANYIKTNSNGNAVIVMGDTNSRYTRSVDNFETSLLLECGLKDPWIELVRNGSVPFDGDALKDDSNRNGPNFEVVDKVFYRSSKSVTLTPVSYRLEDTKFVDEKGAQLSDHYPIIVRFQYTKAPNILLSESFGGSGGTAFNYLASLPDSRPAKLSIRSGKRVNALTLTYANGVVLSHGGVEGVEKSINLDDDEYITQVYLCKGLKNGDSKYRIAFAEFMTNKGQVLSGGTKTSDAIIFTVPSGWYIGGFFGRSGNEVDKLGVIYKPLALPLQ